jgi:hypothetical protein
VYASRSDPPTPRARAAARAAQRPEQEKAARKKERRIRRRERREQRDEEYQLREQQGLSPPATPENSSSDEEEEEESNGGASPPLPPPDVESSAPVAKGRRGGRGAGARAGCGNTHHRAVRGRGGVRRGGTGERRESVWERCDGDDGRHRSACRTLEEEETRLLHLEVSSHSSRRSGFEGLELSFLSPCSQGGTDHPRPCAC